MTVEKPTVLMLDDDTELIETTKSYFEEVHGHPFVGSTTVDDGILKLHDTPGKVVAFVDIHIKGSKKSGFDFLSYIRDNAWYRVVPYAFTGEVSLTVEMKALAAGAINVFHKGVDPVDRLVAYAEGSLVGQILRNAVEDDLTHVFRFSFFQRKITDEMRSARERMDDQHPSKFSLLIVDPNAMRRINDTYGPLEGDKVLEVIAGIVKGNVRPNDSICRKSGDKFLVWLPNVDRLTALDIGREIGKTVAARTLVTEEGDEFNIGVSCAAAELHREDIETQESKQLDHLIRQVYTEVKRGC